MSRAMTGGVRCIRSSEYTRFLPELKHVFLVGDLQTPPPHPFVRDERVELIVCSYEPGDDGLFHWHPTVTEYELVVDGEVGYQDVATSQMHWFEAGDLSVIPAGTCVRRIVRARARTVALKVPSNPEKVHCRQCERVCDFRVEPKAVSKP